MLACLIIASIFWFNPLISNVDILPDVVGYLLVVKAFNKASYVYSQAEEVCTSAKKMVIITGVKLFSIALVSSLDPTMSLLLSFCFALIEIVFGIPFVNSLFKLFTRLGYDSTDKTIDERAHKIRILTIAFLIIRLVMAMLPDLTALSLNSALGVGEDFSYIRFRPLFHMFSGLIVAVIGVIWLVKFIAYVRKAITKDVTEKCKADFINQSINKSSVFVAKANIRAIIVIGVASLFVFDFSWGYTYADVLQDFILPFVVICSFAYLAIKGMYKIGKYFLLLIGAFTAHIIVNILEIKKSVAYFEKYNVASALKISRAESMYFELCVLTVASAVMLAISCTVILLLMRNNARNNIVKHSKLFSESDIDYYLQEFDKRTKKNMIITVGISVLNVITSSLSVILRPYTDAFIIVNIVAQVLLVIFFISSTLYLHDEVYKRILIFS
ncbi:MAG: hypothetical protein J6B29_02025 [Clostridia bacterium]|nr:hypothetical protein [Clostridia bacterium]